MNDGLEAATSSPVVENRRQCLRWLVVLLLALAAGMWLWKSSSPQDPRLVGQWRSRNGTIRRFHADGRTELSDPAGATIGFGPRFWFVEKGELVICSRQSVRGNLKGLMQWAKSLFAPKSRVLAFALNDDRYQIVELTDTTLHMRRFRPSPALQLPIETFEKMPAK
jgi:hypothetical protein